MFKITSSSNSLDVGAVIAKEISSCGFLTGSRYGTEASVVPLVRRHPVGHSRSELASVTGGLCPARECRPARHRIKFPTQCGAIKSVGSGH